MPFHDLPHGRIHYLLAGPGGTGTGEPALVFVHGGCCSSDDWRCQFDTFRTERTVMAIDLGGHGESTGNIDDCTIERWAGEVNALIVALGIGPVILIGHSLGSRVAAEAACQRPGQAAGLILIDGSRSVGGFAAIAPPADSAPPPLKADELAAILDSTIGPYADTDVRRAVIATMSAAPMALMQRAFAAYTKWDAGRADHVYAGLGRRPVLAIQSTYHDSATPRHSLPDQATTTPYLDQLKQALPQVQIAILPETGHFSMLERPQEVNQLIRNFAQTLTDPERDIVAAAFRASVAIYERMATPLYAEFSRHAAADPAMLELASHGMAGARPTHLFSAVHYLLLGSPDDPLARYFATLTSDPLPVAGAYGELARFCRQHYDAILELLKTRSVQTTYAERCRAILAPMCEVARAAGEPLNIVEIGCSAGVLLVFDKFAYDLDSQGVIGDPDAPLLLEGDLQGGPKLFMPRIGKRSGLDLHTIDVGSADERRWLLALCFPELRDEQVRLAKALEVVAATGITLYAGDALGNLRAAIAAMPDPLCIFHSACLFYWPAAARLALEDMLVEASRDREFWRIGIEPAEVFGDWLKGGPDGGEPVVGGKSGAICIYHYRQGEVTCREAGRPSADYGTTVWY